MLSATSALLYPVFFIVDEVGARLLEVLLPVHIACEREGCATKLHRVSSPIVQLLLCEAWRS